MSHLTGINYLKARQKQVREELERERRNNPGMRGMASAMERELIQLHEEIQAWEKKHERR